MENIQITKHKDIAAQIALLKAERTLLETEMKTKFDALVDSLRPVNLIKEALFDLGKDHDVQNEFAKTGLGIGVNYVVDKFVGNNGVKSFIKSFFIKGALTTMINHNIAKISSVVKNYISDLTHQDDETEENQTEQTEEENLS